MVGRGVVCPNIGESSSSVLGQRECHNEVRKEERVGDVADAGVPVVEGSKGDDVEAEGAGVV